MHRSHDQIIRDILRLKSERKAVILCHLYQRGEVQDIADYVGDSLGLSQQAAATDARVIVFCGVHFMAETAAILCPDKTVLLPEEHAGCPMADTIDADSLRAKKREMPGATVVCYVNTTAAVKAESDICCTSANAAKVVSTLDPAADIIFIPDRNLAHYVSRKAGRSLVAWPGTCPTHDRLTADDVIRARKEHPDAAVLVHPECRPEVVALADHVSSTAGMLAFVRAHPAPEFIIGTEYGILHQLQKENPTKRFHMASPHLICPNMKATTLEKVLWALESDEPRVTVPEDIRTRARKAIDRMMAVGR